MRVNVGMQVENCSFKLYSSIVGVPMDVENRYGEMSERIFVWHCCKCGWIVALRVWSARVVPLNVSG